MKKNQWVVALILSFVLSSSASWAKEGFRSLEQSSGSDVIDLAISESDLIVTGKDHEADFVLHTALMRDRGYEIAKLNLYKIDASGKRHFIESEHIPLKKQNKETKRLKLEMGEVDSSSPHYVIDLIADANKLAVYDFSLTGQDFSLTTSVKARQAEEQIAECDNASFGDCQVDFVIDRMFGPEGKVEFVPAAMESLYSSVIFDEDRNKWQIELPAGEVEHRARKKHRKNRKKEKLSKEQVAKIPAAGRRARVTGADDFNSFITDSEIRNSSIYDSFWNGGYLQSAYIRDPLIIVDSNSLLIDWQDIGSYVSSIVANGSTGGGFGIFGVQNNVVSNSGSDYENDDFVFGSPSLSGDNNPAYASRLFFDKNKSAFRVGASSNLWGDQHVGNYSFAAGYEPMASGDSSIAMGRDSLAQTDNSIAIGANTIAGLRFTGGPAKFATAIGTRAFAGGFASMALGMGLKANADSAFVIGTGVNDLNASTEVLSTSSQLLNNQESSLAIGFNSNIPTLFVGSSEGLGTTGKVGVGTTNPQAKLDVAGDINATDLKINGQSITSLIGGSSNAQSLADQLDVSETGFAYGAESTAYGFYHPTVAMGQKAKAWIPPALLSTSIDDRYTSGDGTSAIAFGANVQALGTGSFALGRENQATGRDTFALGYRSRAKGSDSFALGNNASAEGKSAMSFGEFSQAYGDTAIALGYRAEAYSSNRFDSTLDTSSLNERQSGGYSVAIGSGLSSYDDSVAIGRSISASNSGFALGHGLSANGSIVIGSGSNNQALANDIADSIMLGTNSDRPTLFIGAASALALLVV